MIDTPFETIDSAHHYVKLLSEQVVRVEKEIVEDIATLSKTGPKRRLDAFRLVQYKLKQLNEQLVASSRLLNDLALLHRMLIGDEDERAASPVRAAHIDGTARAA